VNTHSGPSALRRRDEILRVVREESIHSQEELQRRLATRGFQVAQPTLSRDLRDLGLAKTAAGYVAPDSTGGIPAPAPARDHAAARLERALRTYVRSVATAHTLVVVKTPTAAAHPVGLAIDQAELAEVVGSIAGDDTVFLATVSPETAVKLAARLNGMLERPRSSRRAQP
jgi:transcriptional regulator of arginine metabolism